MTGARRAPAVVAVVLVLLGAWIADTRLARPQREVSAQVQAPMGARPSARSSAWFCAGATAAPDGAANGSVVIANAADKPLTGRMTVVPNEGDPVSIPVSALALGRASYRLTDVLTAPFASALVELDGGSAVVELVGAGPLGETITPCASSASTSWYFAEGVTTRDALEVITLFNPFPEDAVVDLVFNTEEGEVTPQALTGLSVRGRGVAAINLGEHVQRRVQVTAQITARAGRLVAARLQTFDGTEGRKGLSLGLGAPAPGDVWYFPEGFLVDGLTERFQVFNPGGEEAQVQLELSLEQGLAEPILLTVPPASRITVTANEEARIPKSVAHAVTVRSNNGVPVVVERTIDAVAPAPRAGLAITLGARLAARSWVVAAGQIDDANDQWLVVQNPGAAMARLAVSLLDEGRTLVPLSLERLEVGPKARRGLKLNDSVRRGNAALILTSDQPVVVERDYYKVRGLGTAMAAAIPLRP